MEDKDKPGQGMEDDSPAIKLQADILAGAEIEFPVTFDLRIIYVLAEGADIVADLEAIYKELRVPCSMIQGVAKPGAKYGRMGSRLRFESKEQMYSTYEAISKLPYVKTAI